MDKQISIARRHARRARQAYRDNDVLRVRREADKSLQAALVTLDDVLANRNEAVHDRLVDRMQKAQSYSHSAAVSGPGNLVASRRPSGAAEPT